MKKARKDSQALPIKKYDDRSVREIKKELDGLSDKELRKVHEYDLHRRHRSACQGRSCILTFSPSSFPGRLGKRIRPRPACGDGGRLRPAVRRGLAARPERLHRRGHGGRARLDFRPTRHRRTRSEGNWRPHRACGRRNGPANASRVAPGPQGLASQEATFGVRAFRKDGTLTVSGASMALTAAVYRTDRWPRPGDALEDEQLESVLHRHGVPIERLLSVRVTTSARFVGRASQGLAHDLSVAAKVLKVGE
jgi:hypothetical protein